jgi:hypothetical protein
MFSPSEEPITNEEIEYLERVRRGPFINRIFGNGDSQHAQEQHSVDVYQASVLKCFIPSDFNEEHPLYILDLDGIILVLFGQWIFDPHILVTSEEVFEAWNCNRAFFGTFSLRCLTTPGLVLRLTVEDAAFVEAQRLPSLLRFKQLRECQFVIGNEATLVRDLERGGLIEPP